jgi:hypothetical protein
METLIRKISAEVKAGEREVTGTTREAMVKEAGRWPNG